MHVLWERGCRFFPRVILGFRMEDLLPQTAIAIEVRWGDFGPRNSGWSHVYREGGCMVVFSWCGFRSSLIWGPNPPCKGRGICDNGDLPMADFKSNFE